MLWPEWNFSKALTNYFFQTEFVYLTWKTKQNQKPNKQKSKTNK